MDLIISNVLKKNKYFIEEIRPYYLSKPSEEALESLRQLADKIHMRFSDIPECARAGGLPVSAHLFTKGHPEIKRKMDQAVVRLKNEKHGIAGKTDSIYYMINEFRAVVGKLETDSDLLKIIDDALQRQPKGLVLHDLYEGQSEVGEFCPSYNIGNIRHCYGDLSLQIMQWSKKEPVTWHAGLQSWVHGVDVNSILRPSGLDDFWFLVPKHCV